MIIGDYQTNAYFDTVSNCDKGHLTHAWPPINPNSRRFAQNAKFDPEFSLELFRIFIAYPPAKIDFHVTSCAVYITS